MHFCSDSKKNRGIALILSIIKMAYCFCYIKNFSLIFHYSYHELYTKNLMILWALIIIFYPYHHLHFNSNHLTDCHLLSSKEILFQIIVLLLKGKVFQVFFLVFLILWATLEYQAILFKYLLSFAMWVSKWSYFLCRLYFLSF